MDYKTLYSIIFAPILLSMIYMVYLQFQKPDTTTNTSSITNTQMTNQNISQISLEEFKTELLDEDVILIDVRSAQEQATYWVISEIQEHIVYGSPAFEAQIANLDTTKKYLVYCWHWVRSAAVREYMQSKGFEWVKDLEGGINAWNKD